MSNYTQEELSILKDKGFRENSYQQFVLRGGKEGIYHIVWFFWIGRNNEYCLSRALFEDEQGRSEKYWENKRENLSTFLSKI